MNDISKRFLSIECSQIPLVQVDYSQIKKEIIDPTTNQPYKGIILEGVFADLSNKQANNNGRFYNVEQYLELVGRLRQQIHSPKGVYGELEHPKSYAVNFNNVSHKIIDIWYDPNTQRVMGQLILLNTDKGKIAQEIVKSGGCLAISARAAGTEEERHDGTKQATTKLLTTYDLVYHPGFSSAVMGFKELNESQKLWHENSSSKNGFCLVLRDSELKSIDKEYEKYVSLKENSNDCFFEWYGKMHNLFEDEEQKSNQKSKQKKQQQVLQKNKTNDQDDKERQLQIAAQKDLKERQVDFFRQVKQSQEKLRKRYNQLDRAYFDNSAGFVTDGMGGNMAGQTVGVSLTQEEIEELRDEFNKEQKIQNFKNLN